MENKFHMCCEKCLKQLPCPENKPGCLVFHCKCDNPSCKCHLKTTASTPENERLRGETPESEKLSNLPKCNIWEDNFDILSEDCRIIHLWETKQFKRIKDFIKETLADQKAKDREELEKFGTECSTNCDNFVEWKLKKYREELIEWCEKGKNSVPENWKKLRFVNTKFMNGHACGYNQALSDIINKIKNNE